MNVSYEAEPEPEEYEQDFDADFYIPNFNSLYDFASEKQIIGWLRKWRQMIQVNEPDHVVKEWFENLRKIHGPHVIGVEECTMRLDLFRAVWRNLPRSGRASREEDGTDHGDCTPPGPK